MYISSHLFFFFLNFLKLCPINLFTFCDISNEKEKELALKKYQSLETTNKLLKEQVTVNLLDMFDFGRITTYFDMLPDFADGKGNKS